MASHIRNVEGGVLVTVTVRPRSRPGIEARQGGIVVRVKAPPSEGRATEEARRALAADLGVAPSRVSLVRGSRSRTKVFRVDGVDAIAAAAFLP